ncbi:LysR family transcriptional regulator [Woeseia oceani]|uniref:LysR family transcriptional regulator n=1 Tax=Woeseia oceani TaxID=1548547 RepID=A0A193LJC2_9GAMM|nr:LysR family transcriptional regulator [Woeseia oceani]ANO52556.1 LysR family transcriptional regulator [Woeseia oceani]
MDTELARTFLTVVSAGNFVKAAERLFVTQSTVSARIQSLEQQLGCRLFVRNKAGAFLTAEGQLFQKYAVSLLRTVERAHQAVGVPHGFRASLTIGARFALWEDLLLPWLGAMRHTAPDIALRTEIGFEDDLMLGLVEGGIDIAVLYTPQSRPGLTVEPLLVEELILVSTDKLENVSAALDTYVHVDWGPEFMARHAAQFPDISGFGLTANVGWIGIEYLLMHGGCGYFPLRTVSKYLADQRLHRVDSAPAFQLPAYLVYPSNPESGLLDTALTQIRDLAGSLAKR